MAQEEKKVELYKVYKVVRKSGNHYPIERNLSLSEAKRLVATFPNNDKNMVCFCKQ